VAGGIDVPIVLGGRGTLLVAELGGWEGRPLRRGDRLPIGAIGASPWEVTVELSTRVRVVLGPDRSAFPKEALDLLLDAPFRISATSNRTGTRLEGPSLARAPGAQELSCPMVQGAIQVPASREPIVLGPDHPTIGGYPVIATVVRHDLGAFHAVPFGGDVRFAEA
jgi:allophanate hydrolase subunit 2